MQQTLQEVPKAQTNSLILKDYNSLVKIWKRHSDEQVQTDYKQSLQVSTALLALLNSSPCVTAIIDLRTQQVDYISSNTLEVFGYESSYFTEQGMSFFNEIAHPEDLPKTWKLIKNIWSYILKVPPVTQTQYKFNYDYRTIKPDGKEARILAQNSVLQLDSKGNITHVLGIYSDISHWKKSEHQMASVMSTTHNTCFFFTSDECGTLKPRAMLSKRELEIVKLISEGYSSKLIADKLYISFHTVNTHRQKIMEKTNTKNTGGLIQFALSHGLI